jgi:hypothetical protein
MTRRVAARVTDAKFGKRENDDPCMKVERGRLKSDGLCGRGFKILNEIF